MWQNNKVADRTLFLWTADNAWVYHTWLSQLTFFGLTHAGGPRVFPCVVLVFTIILALAPFALAMVLWIRRASASSWMVLPFALALEAIAIRFQPRPELFTELFLSFLLIFLVAWSGTPGQVSATTWRNVLSALALVLAMFVAWANFHGGVVVGLLVLASTAACDLVQDRFNRRARALAVLSILAPVAVCLNPYGFSYWKALQPTLGSGFANIIEWRPLWKSPALPPEIMIGEAVLVPLALGAWILNPRRRWAHLGWILTLGVLFVRARRMVWPFTVVNLLVLAANADSLRLDGGWNRIRRISLRVGDSTRDRAPKMLRAVVGIGLLTWLILQCASLMYEFRPWRALTPLQLERGIVAFVQKHRLGGRMFNDYENSSYLQWRFAGDPPLYIDLLNAYPDQVIEDYQDVVDVTARGRELLESQDIGFILLTTNRPPPSLAPLALMLDSNKEKWARVYAGDDGVIWVRRNSQYRPIWAKYAPTVLQTDFATLERWHHGDPLVPPASREDDTEEPP
jgi:hypothetical protein